MSEPSSRGSSRKTARARLEYAEGMNYLAHLHLGGPGREDRLGSLYGDFVKGSADVWPAGIAAGIRLHRRIDVYTDDHPLVIRAKTRLPAARRRVAGLLVDVFFDHCLARHTHDAAQQPRPENHADCAQSWRPPTMACWQTFATSIRSCRPLPPPSGRRGFPAESRGGRRWPPGSDPPAPGAPGPGAAPRAATRSSGWCRHSPAGAADG